MSARKRLENAKRGHRCGPTGKAIFKSLRSAMDRAEEIRVESSNSVRFKRAYRCDFCGWYHLTSKPARKIVTANRGVGVTEAGK